MTSQSRPENSTVGVPARLAALRLLDAVLRQGQRLDVVAGNATRALAAEDCGLAIAITGEVLRRLPDLDALIDSATAQPLPLDAKARTVLRIALAQALRLETPPHAAISTVLPLVTGGPKRLVHGVFGTLIRREARLPEVLTLPPAIVARWAHWGYAMLGEAARSLAEPPPVDIRWKDGRCETLARGTDVTALPGYGEGEFWVQNRSAQVPADLLGPGNGRTVLDLCAAPGGKTMQLAAAGWRVIAVESNAKRIERLRANLARTRLNAELVHADVMTWQPSEPVDAILLDAPCSATGIFARHPDVLHRIGPRDIAALSALQSRMLARALGWLSPRGRLVYATCSLEREEGEAVVERFAGQVVPVEAGAVAPDNSVGREGWVRLLPGPGQDGFFIALLRSETG